VLNAANEIAVGAFLEGRIGFLEIVAVVEAVLDAGVGDVAASLDDILAVDAIARQRAETLLARWPRLSVGTA
jgi:1-deoxy-D-xylulose-5-phosphate reductoisomerase